MSGGLKDGLQGLQNRAPRVITGSAFDIQCGAGCIKT